MMSKKIIREGLRASILSLEANFVNLDKWVYARTSNFYGSSEWNVNEKTRNLYSKLRPLLNDMHESIDYLAILIEGIYDEKRKGPSNEKS